MINPCRGEYDMVDYSKVENILEQAAKDGTCYHKLEEQLYGFPCVCKECDGKDESCKHYLVLNNDKIRGKK